MNPLTPSVAAAHLNRSSALSTVESKWRMSNSMVFEPTLKQPNGPPIVLEKSAEPTSPPARHPLHGAIRERVHATLQEIARRESTYHPQVVDVPRPLRPLCASARPIFVEKVVELRPTSRAAPVTKPISNVAKRPISSQKWKPVNSPHWELSKIDLDFRDENGIVIVDHNVAQQHRPRAERIASIIQKSSGIPLF